MVGGHIKILCIHRPNTICGLSELTAKRVMTCLSENRGYWKYTFDLNESPACPTWEDAAKYTRYGFSKLKEKLEDRAGVLLNGGNVVIYMVKYDAARIVVVAVTKRMHQEKRSKSDMDG